MRRVADFIGAEVPAAAWPAVIERCRFETMRDENGAWLGEVDMIFEGGVKSFVFKGTNGRWRDVLTADELAAYAARVATAVPPDCAAWLERGRAAAS
jgi:aryl sulfotransferase